MRVYKQTFSDWSCCHSFELKAGESLDGYERLSYHVVWDCQFDNHRNPHVVLQGDKQESITDESYSGVVSLQTIRIMFLLATVNKLQLWAADVENAFLNGITRDKLYIIAGPEFGPEREGKALILYKSMYSAPYYALISINIWQLNY